MKSLKEKNITCNLFSATDTFLSVISLKNNNEFKISGSH